MNTKRPDYVLKSAQTLIKVTVLPLSLTYAVYPRSEHCEWALMQGIATIFIYLSFLDMCHMCSV